MRCIGKLASLLSKQLDIDENTRLVKCIKFACVLVEVNASSNLPKTITVIDKQENVYVQEVEYEFVPPKCGEWKCFGHINHVASIQTSQNNFGWKKQNTTISNYE